MIRLSKLGRRLIALVVASVLVVPPSVLRTALAGTCSNVTIAGDREMWEGNRGLRQQSTRDQLAWYYNLQKNNWDEEWGWAKYNDTDGHKWEFVKMLTAGDLLFGGINDETSNQGTWTAASLSTLPAAARPKVSVVSRSPNTADVFFRDANDKLRQVHMVGTPWQAGQTAPTTTTTVVSDLVANDKDDFRITSDPIVVSRDANSIDVFAIASTNLIHFSWTSAGWSAVDVTTLVARPTPVFGSDRYFITSNLAVVKRGSKSLDVVAIDNYRHVIHHSWDDGIWSATDLTVQFGDEYRASGQISVVSSGTSGLGLATTNNSNNLVYFSWKEGSGWIAHNVSTKLGVSRAIESKVAIAPVGSNSAMLYYRSGYALHAAVWAPQLSLIGPAPEGYRWYDFNITNGLYAVEGNPVAVTVGSAIVDVFIRDINGHVIHSYLRSEFGIQDVTVQYPYMKLASDPIAIASGNERVDVFGLSLGNHVIHYWRDKSLSWAAENLYASPQLPSGFAQSVDGIHAVTRGTSAIEVFAGNQLNTASYLHFSALIGVATNSWHTNKEYREWASGRLQDFRYEPEDSDDAVASSIRGSFTTDRVEMKCPAFEDSETADRASTMLHESTHMAYWRFKHQSNPNDDCDEPCSDNWFRHGVRETSGRLGSSSKNHSMVQTQIEFLCDISEFAADDIPLSAYQNARNHANNKMGSRIIDPPGWTCGVPRPLS
jgi:hypothetical protein